MRFILVDRVDYLEAGKEARGYKNITLADDTFDEHFPEHPIFPGTLIIESLAQISGFLCECTHHSASEDTRRAILMQVNNAKFFKPCRPSDRLRLVTKIENQLETAMRVHATATVEDDLVAEAILTFRLVEVNSPNLHARRVSLYKQWLQDLCLSCPIR